MSEPIAVPVGPCRCPGTPHGDGDFVYLRPVLGLTGGLAVEAAMTEPNPTLAVSLALIHHNVVGWTFEREGRDEKNRPVTEPVPVDPDTIEEWLPWSKGGETVANRAAALHLDDAFGPLRARLETVKKAKAANKPLLAGHNAPSKPRRASASAAGSDGEPSPTDP